MHRNVRMALSVIWVVVGAALMTLSVTEVLKGAFAGMGGALTAIGLLQLARQLRYRQDPSYRERVDAEESDERNRYIRMRSWTWTGPLAVVAEFAASLIALALGEHTVQLVLSYTAACTLLAYCLTYFVLQRRY